MKKLMLFCLLMLAFTATKADPVITKFYATPSENYNIRVTGNSLSVNFYMEVSRSYPPQGGSILEPGTITLRLVYKTSSGQIEPITDYKTYTAADYNNGAFLDININNITVPSSSIGKTLTVQYSYWSSTIGQTMGPMLSNTIYSIIGNTVLDPTTITSTPMPIVIKANSLLAVFAKMPNENVAYKSKLSADWTPWQDLSGPIKYAPAPISKDDATMDLFIIGTDNRLYHKWWDRWQSSNATQGWSGWNNFGGSFAASPTVITKDNGQSMDLFALGLDNHLYQKWWIRSNANNASGGWSQWVDLGGGFLTTPAVVGRNNGTNLDFFAVGTNNHLYSKWWSSSSGSSVWYDWGGNYTSAPALISKDGSSLDLFIVGSDNVLYTKWYTPSTGWSGWNNLGGAFTSTPAVIATGTQSYDIFVKGTDNHLYHGWWSQANGWSGWGDLGGNLTSPPTAIRKDNQSIDVFAQGANNSLIRRSYNTSSGWSNWEVVSGN